MKTVDISKPEDEEEKTMKQKKTATARPPLFLARSGSTEVPVR